jgi:hypothetical protein
MAGIEMDTTLDPATKNYLRIAYGVLSGISTGVLLQRAIPQIQSSMDRALKGWSQARAAWQGVDNQIKTLQSAGQAVSNTMTAQLARLKSAVDLAACRVNNLRRIGGTAVGEAERLNALAQNALDKLKSAANRPGLAPSERAALLCAPAMRQARDAVRRTNANLTREYQNIDRFLQAGRSASTQSGRLIIASAPRRFVNGNPEQIQFNAGGLNNRQQRLLDLLSTSNTEVTVGRNQVNLKDIAALQAATRDEFAILTRGGSRLVIRGQGPGLPLLSVERAEGLAAAGWRWSVVDPIFWTTD